MAIDVFFYRKLVCVPWNIVAYNVFSGKERGPDIYGTEPWHFYMRNLLLNFNAWFVLAILAFPTVLLQRFAWGPSATRQSFLRNVVIVSPFYLWLAIFSLQPHKEERFMYPAYPLLGLNAAITLHTLLIWLGSRKPRTLMSKIPAKVKIFAVIVFMLASILLSELRTVGMITAYSAPLKIYAPLKESGLAHPGDTVCFGKEWYRFPSSYFLPNGMKAKFIKSEFTGLLPGEFSEAKVGFGFFPGAWLEPPGMNDENKEDPGKYVSIFSQSSRQTTCSYRLSDGH
jgi:alpha-1,2-mannosyltransferase